MAARGMVDMPTSTLFGRTPPEGCGSPDGPSCGARSDAEGWGG